MKKENSFVKAGAILVISGFIVKVLSAAYRIPLTRMLGAGLMGRYSSVLNIFMPFFSFATAGIVPTVARFTAQVNDKDNENITNVLIKQALKLYISIAFAVMVLFVVFGRIYADYTGERVFFSGAVILAVCIPVSTAEMVFKGFTQGRMDMMITAKANVLEGTVKTVSGLLAVFCVVNYMSQYPDNLPVYACFASVTMSGIISAAYLVKAVKIKDTENGIKTAVNNRQMLSMSVPVASSALVISLVNFFDTAVCLPVIKSLPYKDIVQSFDGASFMGAEEISMYLFGIYQGMALTVFNLVPAVIASVGAACLPVLTRAQGFKDKTYLRRQSEKLYRIIALLSVPAGVFIFCFCNEIVQFLFGTSEGQTVIAAELIAILIPFCVFSCFTSAFNSVINAFGKSHIAFKILVVASVVKCVLSIVLCSVPNINIRGFAVSSAVFYTIIFVMSAIYTGKLGVRFKPGKILFIPVTASVLIVWLIQWFVSPLLCYLPLFLRLGFTGVIFCTAYMIIIWFTGFTVDI